MLPLNQTTCPLHPQYCLCFATPLVCNSHPPHFLQFILQPSSKNHFHQAFPAPTKRETALLYLNSDSTWNLLTRFPVSCIAVCLFLSAVSLNCKNLDYMVNIVIVPVFSTASSSGPGPPYMDECIRYINEISILYSFFNSLKIS